MEISRPTPGGVEETSHCPTASGTTRFVEKTGETTYLSSFRVPKKRAGQTLFLHFRGVMFDSYETPEFPGEPIRYATTIAYGFTGTFKIVKPRR